MTAIPMCVCIVGLGLLFTNVTILARNLRLFLLLILPTCPGILFPNVVVCYPTSIVAHFPSSINHSFRQFSVILVRINSRRTFPQTQPVLHYVAI